MRGADKVAVDMTQNKPLKGRKPFWHAFCYLCSEPSDLLSSLNNDYNKHK